MRLMYIDLNRLIADEEIAGILIRLMMACNDLTLANTCLAKYQDDTTPKNQYINNGARMYFVRLQIGHLHEGLKVIKEICDNERLKNSVKTCFPDAKNSI